MPALLIRSASLVSSTETTPVDVLVRDGVIEKLAFHDSPTYALPSMPNGPMHEVIDAAGLLLMPSLIDCHVHFREPGYEHKGTMQSEAAAARAGGLGTVCDMPNTNPPTVTVAALADKARRAAEIADCDIRFYFGVTEPDHAMALEQLWLAESEELRRLKTRCCGVKVYLDHSTGNQKIQDDVLGEVFRLSGAHGFVVAAHCEDPAVNAEAAKTNTRTDVAAHSLLRPPESEVAAVRHVIDLSRRYGARLHVTHMSTKGALDLVRSAKREGLRVTCDVTPHHLFLSTGDYDPLGTKAKMNPPLRTPDHAQALWEGIADGTVDCIATDHAPHTLEEKTAGDPLKAPSGVPGVETMLPLLLTAASRGDPTSHIPHPKLRYEDIVRLCFEHPNQIFGLGKPGIAEGERADFVLVDPKAAWTIHADTLRSACRWTPYEGWAARGKVVRSIY